jgi:hypothetical protein
MRICGYAATVLSFAGWLTVRRTEAAVIAANAKACKAFAIVSIGNHDYLTCSYLAHRRMFGVTAFVLGWLVAMAVILISRFGQKT